MFACGPAFFGTAEPLFPASYILYAPFNSTTTATDVISPELTPIVTVTSGTSLTFGATSATINTLSNPGYFPTLVYGDPSYPSKLSPADYASDSLFFSAYINLTGVAYGTSTFTTVSDFLTLQYQGNSVSNNKIVFSAYVNTSTIYIQTQMHIVANNSDPYTVVPGPSSGEHNYSIEWTPTGETIFRLDNEIVRYTAGATRPTTDFGAILTVSGPSYGGESPGGIYEATVRDVTYEHRPYVPVYSWATRYGYQLSNGGRTLSVGGGTNGVLSSIILSGKVYCEFECTAPFGTTGMFNAFGVTQFGAALIFNFSDTNGSFIYSRDDYSAGCGASGAGVWINGTESPNTSYRFTYGDRIGIAFDSATKQMWVRKNGVWIVGDPESGTSPSATLTATGPFCFATSNYECGSPAVTYGYTMYPNTAAMSSGVPAGFIAYDPA